VLPGADDADRPLFHCLNLTPQICHARRRRACYPPPRRNADSGNCTMLQARKRRSASQTHGFPRPIQRCSHQSCPRLRRKPHRRPGWPHTAARVLV
jgi:hypothetical protein